MKVFLSYGHDQNTPLVERLGGDLKAAGHGVWIDQSEIKAGEDWRRSIVDGLSDTDWVLGFLSKHSTRDPGVCLDELAIALHTKGGAIATVLVEGEGAVEPPVSVSHIQWLDMHDWAERQAAGGANWESWYRAKLDEILNLLASPATQRFAGEIEELDRRLKPIAQEADIGLLADGFVGREWLRTALDEWRRHSKDSRLFWLSGAAGTGKSAFAAWLAHRGKVNVIGLNLCRYNIDDRRDPARVIRTLTFQIATRLPDYRRLLLDKLTVQDAGGDELARKGPGDLFGFLLIETLRLAIDGGRRDDRYLIVIDGLDETVRDGRSELAELLAEQAKKLPAWMAILVTSRPEEPILRQFGELQPHWIRAESPENLGDVRIYAREWLAGLDLPQREAPALIDRVLAASEGNFLYLRMLREAVTAGTLSLFAPEGLPRGLIGLYERWFRRQFPDRQTYEAYVPVLAVLAAAEHPVPESWLARIFGWSKREEARMLEGLGSLFQRRPDGVAPFHKSLRDWLIDPRSAGADFVVDEAEGTCRLATTLWAEFVRWALAEDSGGLDPFCVTELPAQIERSQPGDIKALLANSSPWPTIWLGLVRTAKSQAQNFAWETALGWWRSTATLASTSGDKALPDQATALAEAGDILITLGRSAAALASYQASLAIRDRLAKADPGNAGWQRDLSVSHNKIGDVQSVQGDLEAALTSYQASLAILDALVRREPDNTVSQRNLAVGQIKIGEVLAAQGDPKGALEAYQSGLKIIDALVERNPTNTEWWRDLSANHERIGDVLMAQGESDGALREYRGSHVVAEMLARHDPGSTEWQRDLGLSHMKIGEVLAAQRDQEGALEAYRSGLTIREALARSDPANTLLQHDLAVSQIKIGDALVARGDRVGALKTYKAGLAIRETLARLNPANMVWHHGVWINQIKIGEVLAAQDDQEGALEEYRRSLVVAEAVSRRDPTNTEWLRDLAVSHINIADVLVAQDDRVDSLTSYRAALAIIKSLARSNPRNALWQRDLWISQIKIANVLAANGDRVGALASYRVALVVIEALARNDLGNTLWQHDLWYSQIKLGDALVVHEREAALQAYRAGLNVIEALASRDPTNREWQSDLIVSCLKISEHDPAEERARLLQALSIANRLESTGQIASSEHDR